MQEKNELRVSNNSHHQTWIGAGPEGSRRDSLRLIDETDRTPHLSKSWEAEIEKIIKKFGLGLVMSTKSK